MFLFPLTLLAAPSPLVLQTGAKLHEGCCAHEQDDRFCVLAASGCLLATSGGLWLIPGCLWLPPGYSLNASGCLLAASPGCLWLPFEAGSLLTAFGYLLAASWLPLAASWHFLTASWLPLGRHLGSLGVSRAATESSRVSWDLGIH